MQGIGRISRQPGGSPSIDYRNLRPKFVETFLAKLVNWGFAQKDFG